MANPTKAAECRQRSAYFREKAARYRRSGNEINAAKCEREAADWDYKASRYDR